MAQFDVYDNPSVTSRRYYPYVVDIQSRYLEALATRIVIPLGRRSLFKNVAMKGLTPEVTFAGEELLVLTPQLSSVPKKQLKKAVGSLAHQREEIVNAVDFAIFGV
ncbi:MAG TPA: plasmid maintenance protein CcdB [Gammaproteobacteria bacterium]|nr:plasmid maintenance protein CcdB [Gammaproteobacteria bacterium]